MESLEFNLPEHSTIAEVSSLWHALVELMGETEGNGEDGRKIVVDAGNVETIDTSCLQALLVAKRSVEQAGMTFEWHEPTDTVLSVAALVALDDELGLRK